MARYYMNENSQNIGDHEVHKEGCCWLQKAKNRKYLGDFSDCHQALKVAKQYDPNADGCFSCCKECNNG